MFMTRPAKSGGISSSDKKTTADHEINLRVTTQRKDGRTELADIGKRFPLNHLTAQTRFGGALDTTTIRPTGDDERNLGGQRTRSHLRDEICQRRASTGDQHGQTNRPVERSSQRSVASHGIPAIDERGNSGDEEE